MTGIIAGEVARHIVKKNGGSEIAQRVAAGLVDAAAGAAAGYTVNAVLGADVTGAAVTTGQAVVQGLVHTTLSAPRLESIFAGG